MVDDLLASVEIGTAQGSLVLALRAANALAHVPVEARPDSWRDVVKATLDRFIADPNAVVRGHKMQPYGGIASAEERAKILAYLEKN